MYTRKQLKEITGLPDKTLRWLLTRLDIEPEDIGHTIFGSPVYMYGDAALEALHGYIFHRKLQKEEYAKGKRCRGGCDRYLPETELNSQQICNHCRRLSWVANEVHHGEPHSSPIDTEVIDDIQDILNTLKTH